MPAGSVRVPPGCTWVPRVDGFRPGLWPADIVLPPVLAPAPFLVNKPILAAQWLFVATLVKAATETGASNDDAGQGAIACCVEISHACTGDVPLSRKRQATLISSQQCRTDKRSHTLGSMQWQMVNSTTASPRCRVLLSTMDGKAQWSAAPVCCGPSTCLRTSLRFERSRFRTSTATSLEQVTAAAVAGAPAKRAPQICVHSAQNNFKMPMTPGQMAAAAAAIGEFRELQESSVIRTSQRSAGCTMAAGQATAGPIVPHSVNVCLA